MTTEQSRVDSDVRGAEGIGRAKMTTLETDTTDLALADVCAAARLKEMIDDLGEGEVYAVTRYVLFLRSVDDLFSRSLDEAPLDDEEYAEDYSDATRESKEDFKTGKALTLDEARSELGL